MHCFFLLVYFEDLWSQVVWMRSLSIVFSHPFSYIWEVSYKYSLTFALQYSSERIFVDMTSLCKNFGAAASWRYSKPLAAPSPIVNTLRLPFTQTSAASQHVLLDFPSSSPAKPEHDNGAVSQSTQSSLTVWSAFKLWTRLQSKTADKHNLHSRSSLSYWSSQLYICWLAPLFFALSYLPKYSAP